MLVKPGLITWLVTMFCASSAIGRSTSSTPAIASSVAPERGNNSLGSVCDTIPTTRPMNTGIMVSSDATSRPVANSVAISQGSGV